MHAERALTPAFSRLGSGAVPCAASALLVSSRPASALLASETRVGMGNNLLVQTPNLAHLRVSPPGPHGGDLPPPPVVASCGAAGAALQCLAWVSSRGAQAPILILPAPGCSRTHLLLHLTLHLLTPQCFGLLSLPWRVLIAKAASWGQVVLEWSWEHGL